MTGSRAKVGLSAICSVCRVTAYLPHYLGLLRSIAFNPGQVYLSAAGHNGDKASRLIRLGEEKFLQRARSPAEVPGLRPEVVFGSLIQSGNRFTEGFSSALAARPGSAIGIRCA